MKLSEQIVTLIVTRFENFRKNLNKNADLSGARYAIVRNLTTGYTPNDLEIELYAKFQGFSLVANGIR